MTSSICTVMSMYVLAITSLQWLVVFAVHAIVSHR